MRRKGGVTMQLERFRMAVDEAEECEPLAPWEEQPITIPLYVWVGKVRECMDLEDKVDRKNSEWLRTLTRAENAEHDLAITKKKLEEALHECHELNRRLGEIGGE
jgi:hypothetical protein